ncbi:MAG TPA: CHAD domain-containing protein, partial [Longimicrobiales bacterium]|nr:CHAD domain-containing protein [Longimicrobiales bacterium]
TLRRELRDAGRELAALRDREAALEALHDLDGESRIPPSVLAVLRAQAARDPEGDRETLVRVRRGLRKTGRGMAVLAGAASAEDWLRALGASYRRARRAFRRARSRPTGEALHALRKRAKDLRYQVEWLAPVWPGVLGAWVEELHLLTDALGRTQDVRVVRRQLEGAAAHGDRRRVALILWDLRRDGRRARRDALARGAKLFTEGAGSFTRRMAALAES